MTFNDYLDIMNTLGRYSLIMDAGSRGFTSYEELRQVFTPDAVFDFSRAGGGVADGVEAIIGVMSGTDKHPSGHHITNPVIDFVDANHATSVCKLISIEKDGAANTGHYADDLVRTGEGWRISKRVAVVYFAQ